MKTLREILSEATYTNNLGAVEMIKFFQNASDKDVEKMQKIADAEDWVSYKKLIKKVLGISLR